MGLFDQVRLYGVVKTNTSWGRVTAGVKEGLVDLGALAGFVPVDDLVDDVVYEGHDAPVAIYVGPPSMVATMASYGQHERRYAILAPNSSWLPAKLLREMQKYATIVAPSTWGAKVVEKWTGKYIEPYLHGVSKQFSPLAHDPAVPRLAGEPPGRLRCGADDGRFLVLHLASTWRQRKGTAELIDAWQRAVAAGELGPNPCLDIIVDAPEGTFDAALGDSTIAFPLRQVNYPSEAMSVAYNAYDVVCQPSRAEGFGLVPLEARAAGTVVCATACTGHADHVHEGDPGVVVIPHCLDGPVDDAPLGELSEAPLLNPNDIAEALSRCYRELPTLAADALAAAPHVAAKWSWRATTEQWLKKEYKGWT